MRPEYLTGEHVYLRAVKESDKEHALAWIESQFPVSQVNAEKIFKQMREAPESEAWTRVQLIICRRENDEVVGGSKVRFSQNRAVTLSFHMAPGLEDADQLRAEALEVLYQWLRNDHEAMLIYTDIPADEVETLATASRLGIVEGARMVEWIARPGHRVDLVMCQWLSEEVEARRA